MNPRLLSFLVATLPLLGCGDDAPPVAPVEEPAEEAPVPVTADCDPDRIVVGNGGPRVSRTASVSVEHGEAPADLRLWVSGPDGKESGDVYENPGATAFLPVQPYPADAVMTWHVRMCGEVFTGTFRTGALMRPVDEGTLDDVMVGKTFALDLRAGDWGAPFDGSAARLAYELGGAFLIGVLEREGGVLRMSISAAEPNNAGGYARDDEWLPVVLDAPLGDNPYAFLELDTFTLPTSDGSAVLHDAIVGVGFDAEGIADAFVEAKLEVSADTCALLGATCQPCADDTDALCVSLTVDDLFGVSL